MKYERVNAVRRTSVRFRCLTQYESRHQILPMSNPCLFSCCFATLCVCVSVCAPTQQRISFGLFRTRLTLAVDVVYSVWSHVTALRAAACTSIRRFTLHTNTMPTATMTRENFVLCMRVSLVLASLIVCWFNSLTSVTCVFLYLALSLVHITAIVVACVVIRVLLMKIGI